MRLKAENALAGPAERQPQALKVILDQVARLDGLVQSLLAVVQPLNLQIDRIDLQAWSAERIATVRAPAEAKRITLRLQAEPLCTQADAMHLSRAVDSLLENAVRHAPDGGAVDFHVWRNERGMLEIGVDDDGPGVPEALQGQLFEPFATGRPDGTGLGLALAREVALAHGGELRYLARPGGGARFEMELPWRAS